MPRRKINKKKTEATFWWIQDAKIPVMIYTENRRNSRVAFGQKNINVRLPNWYSSEQRNKQLGAFQQWVHDIINQKPALLSRYHVEDGYKNGDTLVVRGIPFLIDIQSFDKKTSSSILKGKTIHIRLSANEEGIHRERSIKRLISHAVAEYFQPIIEERVLALNDQYFGKEIQKVQMSYTNTTWGTCSNKKVINLSTRLLLTPEEVADYVIIHELAHLIEMNHSSRFWALVKKAMPEYEVHKEWLKRYGEQCDF